MRDNNYCANEKSLKLGEVSKNLYLLKIIFFVLSEKWGRAFLKAVIKSLMSHTIKTKHNYITFAKEELLIHAWSDL